MSRAHGVLAHCCGARLAVRAPGRKLSLTQTSPKWLPAAKTIFGTRSAPHRHRGGWQEWRTVSGRVAGATGVHDLYVVFKGIGNLSWFRFR